MNLRLKEVRKDEGLSQEEFAKRLNISRGQVACYETGRRDLTNRTISDVCEKFDVNEEWLRFGTGDKYKPEPEVDEIDVLMGMFNPENDEFKTKIIKAMLKLDDNGWNAIKFLAEEILK